MELRIHYSALQRILAEQMFTQDGRQYVRGTPKARCNYAYLEHPDVHGDAQGRLKVEARFSGRSAIDFFGRCVGLGDSFDLSITAVPYYENGAIRFKDVHGGDEARRLLHPPGACGAGVDAAQSVRLPGGGRRQEDPGGEARQLQPGTERLPGVGRSG